MAPIHLEAPGFPPYGRTSPEEANKIRRAIQRFDSANSVSTWDVFLSSPLKRTFTNPNWRFTTRNGC